MRKLPIAALALLVPLAAAQAHTGHPAGTALEGLLHPLGGADHLLAMVMVGLWSAVLARRQAANPWLLPAAFVTAMVAGAALPQAGIALPAVEPGIAGSVVLLGLALLAMPRLPTAAAAATVALFGLLHGFAHGVGLAGSGALWAYGAGLVVMTAGLHIAGVLAGGRLLGTGRELWLRLAGAAAAAAGVAMAVG